MEFTDVVSPRNQADLIKVLADATPGCRFICGGTDFIQTIRATEGLGGILINLDRVEPMRQVTCHDGFITVGAALPFADIAATRVLNPGARCLTSAASQMGSPQIRNRATIGGNIANASACADSIAPLLVLNARIIVLQGDGEKRERHIHDIIPGVEKTSLKYNEVIYGVIFPVPVKNFTSAFIKLGSRSAVAISKINMAVGCCVDPASKTMTDVRVALGAVGTVARRFPRAEKVLENQPYSETIAWRFAEQVSRDVESSIAGRASMPYKRRAVLGVALDVLADCMNGERLWQNH